MNKIPKADPDTENLFNSVVPKGPAVKVWSLFGNPAAFVNGNLFTGVYGADVFVRLGESEREALLKEEGAAPFAPMAGRPMREYVVVPRSWRGRPALVRTWVSRSFKWSGKLPPKGKK